MPNSPEKTDGVPGIGYVSEFIINSVRLDRMIAAREEDKEFLEAGGTIYYTPDQSTWYAMFSPVRNGMKHTDSADNKIGGFAEVYSLTDKSDKDYHDNSPFTGMDVSGIMGKLLMDQIFNPRGNTPAPKFFLTETSKSGLRVAMQELLAEQGNTGTRSRETAVKEALQNISSFVESLPEGENVYENLATKGIKKHPLLKEIFLDDTMPNHRAERAEIYNDLSLFDWSYLKEEVTAHRSNEDTFNLDKRDIKEFEELSNKFENILGGRVPKAGRTSRTKCQALAEILAMNVVVGAKMNGMVRFVYLTNSDWAIKYFDKLAWDREEDIPLVKFSKTPGKRHYSVSRLFIRHPLCFLADTDLRSTATLQDNSLRQLVDTIVPRALSDNHLLQIPHAETQAEIENALSCQSRSAISVYTAEIESFYKSWNSKKTPWVNLFLFQRSQQWLENIEIFKMKGFKEYWRQENKKFVRSVWPMGLYLSLMTEGNIARAAPLIYIGSDDDTGKLLTKMQSKMSSGSLTDLHDTIEEFNSRETDVYTPEKREYFDALVFSVLFFSANQFQTADSYAAIACREAQNSNDPDITGREAFYLRAQLARISAQKPSDLNSAKKYMNIAFGKLCEDNLLGQVSISPVRFQAEEWSRKIVEALFRKYDDNNEDAVSVTMLKQYLAFARRITGDDLPNLSENEKEAFSANLYQKIRFNFLVICMSVKNIGENTAKELNRQRKELITVWNERFGSKNTYLKIEINRNTIDGLPTIERAYIIAAACCCSESPFVSKDLDLGKEISDAFEKKALKAAVSSKIDKPRYECLKEICKTSLEG